MWQSQSIGSNIKTKNFLKFRACQQQQQKSMSKKKNPWLCKVSKLKSLEEQKRIITTDVRQDSIELLCFLTILRSWTREGFMASWEPREQYGFLGEGPELGFLHSVLKCTPCPPLPFFNFLNSGCT